MVSLVPGIRPIETRAGLIESLGGLVWFGISCRSGGPSVSFHHAALNTGRSTSEVSAGQEDRREPKAQSTPGGTERGTSRNLY